MTGMPWLDTFLLACCVALSVMMLLALVRAAKGPRFTDRIVAVNLIGTMTIMIMCILSVYFQQAFLVDIAIVYALLSFISIIVLTRLVIVRRRAQEKREQQEAAATVQKIEKVETLAKSAEVAAPGLAQVIRAADAAEKEKTQC
ncbi:MAG: monovalent cation/H+ antiporter complex subunit F [Clostridia bacterium]